MTKLPRSSRVRKAIRTRGILPRRVPLDPLRSGPSDALRGLFRARCLDLWPAGRAFSGSPPRPPRQGGRMTRTIRRSLALAGLIALAAVPAACVHGQTAPSSAHPTGPVVGVQIMNHGASPVSIAIDSGPGRQPLLVLGAHGVTSFEVPMRNLAESKVLRLSARQLGDA